MDERALRPGRGGDEVSVPGGELLQRREQLLPLGAAARPPHALLGLAGGQVELLERRLLALLRLGRRAREPAAISFAAAARGSKSGSA